MIWQDTYIKLGIYVFLFTCHTATLLENQISQKVIFYFISISNIFNEP